MCDVSLDGATEKVLELNDENLTKVIARLVSFSIYSLFCHFGER